MKKQKIEIKECQIRTQKEKLGQEKNWKGCEEENEKCIQITITILVSCV